MGARGVQGGGVKGVRGVHWVQAGVRGGLQRGALGTKWVHRVQEGGNGGYIGCKGLQRVQVGASQLRGRRGIFFVVSATFVGFSGEGLQAYCRCYGVETAPAPGAGLFSTQISFLGAISSPQFAVGPRKLLFVPKKPLPSQDDPNGWVTRRGGQRSCKCGGAGVSPKSS